MPILSRYAGGGETDEKDREYIRRALSDFHGTLESSLSRAISREEGGADGYGRYLRIMGEIREYAYSNKMPVKKAAREILHK